MVNVLLTGSKIVIETPDALVAKAEARRLSADNAERRSFSFDSGSGIDGVRGEKIAP
jgi:hypothetical protein